MTFQTGERGKSDGTFAPDGLILFMATQNGTRALYRLPPPAVSRIFCIGENRWGRHHALGRGGD
uniref:hypothetical protein n=1 Tax=Sphingomonas sp. TaxID=28214 RepID=UPI0025D900BB|nr:hypothetical protein [Sphingomonas sp.]